MRSDDECIQKELRFAEERGWIKVFERKNFVELCLIPLTKKLKECEKE